MLETVLSFFQESVNPKVLFFLISLLSILELRGALIAALLGLLHRKSFLPIAIGIRVACLLKLLLTYFVPGLFGFKTQ